MMEHEIKKDEHGNYKLVNKQESAWKAELEARVAALEKTVGILKKAHTYTYMPGDSMIGLKKVGDKKEKTE